MATIRDIAEQAGVSIGTVDRILHNRGRYSAQTALKVRRILTDLDFRPNPMASRLSRSRTCRIAVLLPWPHQDSGYWNLTLEGVRRAEADLSPFGLEIRVMHFDRYAPGGYAADIPGLADCDGVLMAPLAESDSRAILGRTGLADGKLPFAFLDTDLADAKRICFIGQDSYTSGLLAGRLMNLLAGTSGAAGRTSGNRTHSVLILSPGADNGHLRSRVSGFRKAWNGRVRELKIGIESDHDILALERVLDRVLAGRHPAPGVSGIFVTDASAHWAAEYLSAHEVRRPLIGYDLVPENRRWLEAGIIDFLLTQRPDEQGYEGVNRLFRRVVLGEVPPERIFTPIDIVTRENLVFFQGSAEKESAE